jgi:hypothetical protein
LNFFKKDIWVIGDLKIDGPDGFASYKKNLSNVGGWIVVNLE